MTRSYFLFGALVVVALTLLSGVIQGRMSERWGKPADILAAARQLDKIPDKFGPWELESSEKMDETVTRILDCAGYILRTYVRKDTGARAQVVVLLGPPGPTSVHTPDICYNSQDFRTVQELEPWDFSDGQQEHSFWGMTLKPVQLNAGGMLRVYHAWTAGRDWLAAKNARLDFAASKYLYKIQLACPLGELSDAGTDKDPGRDFLKHFIPAAQPFLVPPEI
ncbi:MAG: exosortase-associated EpsI family protein [Pirellulaceae bacterium]